jgi:hypothetical protein
MFIIFALCQTVTNGVAANQRAVGGVANKWTSFFDEYCFRAFAGYIFAH